MSTVLFYGGVAFDYFLVMPLIFGFMTHVVPQGVAVMTDMTHYLSFATTLFLAFGVVFEIPVAVILLVWAGITTPGSLTALRPYVLVGAFVVAMFLTPPDAFSQTMLAVPTYLLYELGIFLSRIMVPGYKEVEAQRRQ
jgi:sec-independent protein translocase protein TatC